MAEPLLKEDFDKFADQYNTDMRGDMDAGEGGRLGLVDNVREIGRVQKSYPSLTWLFAHRPIATILVVIGIFLVLYGTLAAGILNMIAPLVGLDLSGLPNVH